jgi:hypothetical protein
MRQMLIDKCRTRSWSGNGAVIPAPVAFGDYGGDGDGGGSS